MSSGIIKKLLKTTTNEKKKHNKIVMLARSKLNSIESKISEALIKNETGNEDLQTIINEENKYREFKESQRNQRYEVKKLILKTLILLKKVKNRY